MAVGASGVASIGLGTVFCFANCEHGWMQIKHGCPAGFFVGLIVATRTFGIALQDEILGCIVIDEVGPGGGRKTEDAKKCQQESDGSKQLHDVPPLLLS